jgi:hypothetical protein
MGKFAGAAAPRTGNVGANGGGAQSPQIKARTAGLLSLLGFAFDLRAT